MQLKTSRKSNRERPGLLLPSGLPTASRTVIPFPELCRFLQTMTSPGAGCGWQRGDFPRRTAAGRSKGSLGLAGARTSGAPGDPGSQLGGGGLRRAGAGSGRPGAGPTVPLTSIGRWRADVTPAGARLQPCGIGAEEELKMQI